MNLRTLSGLIGCNLIWSLHPTFGKILLQTYTPAQAAWMRYASAFITYALIVLARRIIFIKSRACSVPTPQPPAFEIPHTKKDGLALGAIGICTFFLSPIIQMTGNTQSSASETAIIIALEPLITLILASIILREKINQREAIALCTAFVGFSIFSGILNQSLSLGSPSHLYFKILILISLVGEACFSVLGKKLTQKYLPQGIFGSSLLIGIVLMILSQSTFGSENSFFQFTSLNLKNLFAVFMVGPIGTTITYLYYMHVLVNTRVSLLALLLFIQPLGGAIWGYYWFHDTFTSSQLLGSCFILLAILLPILSFKKAKV